MGIKGKEGAPGCHSPLIPLALCLSIANSVPTQVPLKHHSFYPPSPSLGSDHSFLFLLFPFSFLRSRFQLQTIALFPLSVLPFFSFSSKGTLSLFLLSVPLHLSFSFLAVCSGITESTWKKNLAAVTSWPAADKSYTCIASLVQQLQGTCIHDSLKLFVF